MVGSRQLKSLWKSRVCDVRLVAWQVSVKLQIKGGLSKTPTRRGPQLQVNWHFILFLIRLWRLKSPCTVAQEWALASIRVQVVLRVEREGGSQSVVLILVTEESAWGIVYERVLSYKNYCSRVSWM
jgi:hypothetical protein